MHGGDKRRGYKGPREGEGETVHACEKVPEGLRKTVNLEKMLCLWNNSIFHTSTLNPILSSMEGRKEGMITCDTNGRVEDLCWKQMAKSFAHSNPLHGHDSLT